MSSASKPHSVQELSDMILDGIGGTQKSRARYALSCLVEQFDALQAALRLVTECEDALTEDGYAYLVTAANEALASNPARSPDGTKRANRSE